MGKKSNSNKEQQQPTKTESKATTKKSSNNNNKNEKTNNNSKKVAVSDPHKDGTISNTTSSTSAVLAELYKPNDILDKDDDYFTKSNVDTDKPTDGPQLSFAEKVQRFNQFTTALNKPENASAAKPFIYATVAMLTLPVFIFMLMLKIVIPFSILGRMERPTEILNEFTGVSTGSEIPPDQVVLLGMDKVTVSGLCGILVSWMIMTCYTLYAYLDNPPRETAFVAQKQDRRKLE